MSDVLTRILAHKRAEVDLARSKCPEAELKRKAFKDRERRPFLEALSRPGPHGANIIAEIKRGSPSRGLMRPDLDAGLQASLYEKGGASAISVLTDASFFHGGVEDLKAARGAARLPVLRKDFILTPYQIYETAVMGADAVLLIVRALSRGMLEELLGLCREVNLDPLVEVHSEDELDTALAAGAALIGINNRDLATFKTDIRTSMELVRLMTKDCVAVSESGIQGREQVEMLLEAGIFNFLIGESLVKAESPEAHLKHLLTPSVKA